MNIKYVSSKMMANNEQLIVNLLVDNKKLDYIYAINGNDNSEISDFIRKKLNSGEIIYNSPNQEEINSFLAAQIRLQRDELLVATDKYMTIDYPISDELKNALRQYRQDLRDIPLQEGFPENIIWPTNPMT